MGDMHFERLISTEHPLYARAMALYAHSFPWHEQREAESQARILAHRDYRFNLIFSGEAWVGLLLAWKAADFSYVEHFCILPERRGQGYGARALQMLAREGARVILEIDPPVDEVSRRRRAFYERCGFQANAFAHVHPAYHADCAGHALVVMSNPDVLTDGEYLNFERYLRDVVMGN